MNGKEKLKNKKSISLKVKIISLILIIILFITSAISLLVYNKSGQIIEKSITKDVENRIDLLNEKLNSLTESTISTSDVILESGKLKKEISDEEEEELYEYFEGFANVYPHIVNIIFSRHDRMYIYPQNERFLDQVPGTAGWFLERLSEEEDSNWKDPYIDASTREWVITYYKKVVENGEVIGFIEIDISLSHIESIVNSFVIGDTGKLYVTDYNGTISISQINELIGKDLPDKELLEFVNEKENGSIKYKAAKENKFATIKKLDSVIKWKVVGIMPLKELTKESKEILKYIIICAIIMASISMFIGVIMIEKIAKNIRVFNDKLSFLGKGDLTIHCDIDSNDEISDMADIFNQAIDRMHKLIKTTQVTCNDLMQGFSNMSSISRNSTKAIKNITDSIQGIANDSTEQANDTSTMVNYFEELSEAMSSISKSLNDVNYTVCETKKTNNEGIEVVNNLLKATDITNKSTDKVKGAILAINDTSNQIDVIVEAINEIAEQTSLLALNASIEAARAGESGKGFGVVADEVRNLAESSAESAHNIKDLIDLVKSQINSAVEEMKLAQENTEIQTNAVKQTRRSFNSIYDSVESLNSDINNIGVLNNNMIVVKETMEKIVENLADKAASNSEVTREISTMTEMQVTKFDELDNSIYQITFSAAQLEEEILKFKTKSEEN